jgi:N-acetylmuramoyl-L-alanine amidase
VAAEAAALPESLPAQPSEPEAHVRNIRCWTTNDYTRVVIDLQGEARYRKTHLSNPDRLYFDFSKARLDDDLLNRKFAVGDEFLKEVRVGQNQQDVVRVVLDLAKIGNYTVFELHDPLRIVIDIHGPPAPSARAQAEASSGRLAPARPAAEINREPAPVLSVKENSRGLPKGTESNRPIASEKVTGRSSVSAASLNVPKTSPGEKAPEKTEAVQPHASPKAASPTSRGDRTLTRILGLKIGRIVIDPGHGGHDTGTIGPGGTMEKDLVLSVAKDLKELLEENLGAEVILTRKDDSFVSLEERTAIANQHQADLFLSIHANSSRIRSTSGVETYYLNFARTASEREVAARENASTVRNVRDLQDLIKVIAEADKSAESRELAAIVQKKLFGGVQKVFPRTRNRGVRSAPFVVLIGANMPSVLVEVAFISNPRDEKLLTKEDNRDRLARALYAGIEGYMKTLGSDLVQNRAGSN